MHNNYNTNFADCQASAEENLYFRHKISSRQRTEALFDAYIQAAKNAPPGEESKFYKRADEVIHCADFFEFHQNQDGKIIKTLTNRCKNRYCTYCQWIEARRRGKILSGALELAKCSGERIVHLVITLPNCNIEDLHTEINNLHTVISQTLRHFKVKNFYRATEVTYNKKNDTFHPHAHIAVFKYIKISDLCAFAAKSYKKLNPKHRYDFNICYATAKSIEKELAKYIMKPDKLPETVLLKMIQNEALTGIRTRSSGGTMKDYLKKSAEILRTVAAAEKAESIEFKPFKKNCYTYDMKLDLYHKL